MTLSRRRFLQGTGAGVAGSALAGGLIAAGAHADAQSTTGSGQTVPDAFPFHGANQSGVFTPQQSSAVFAAFDVTAADRSALTELFRTLTERARFLTGGGTPVDL